MGKNTLEINDLNFDNEVLKANTPVLVDFWAEWCGPCKAIGPTIEILATEYAGKVKIGKLNVDQNRTIPVKYSIKSIPTLIVFKGGQVYDQLIGSVPKDHIKSLLDRALG